MDGVEESQAKDVQIRGVGRLTDELDVPAISGALPDDIRVVVDVVGRGVVVLGPYPFPPPRSRPRSLDGGNHLLE